MVSTSSHLKQVGSVAIPDLKALFCVQIVRLRIWKVVSLVLDGSRGMERTLYALRKVSLRGSITLSLWRVKYDGGMSICLWSLCRSCRLKIWLKFFSTRKREEQAVTGQTILSTIGPRRKFLTKRRSLCCRWGKMARSSKSALFSSVVSRPVTNWCIFRSGKPRGILGRGEEKGYWGKQRGSVYEHQGAEVDGSWHRRRVPSK